MDVTIGASEDNDLLHRGVPFQGMVDILLKGDELAATVAAVCGDDELRAGVGQTVLDALGAESAEDDAMNGSDPGAGQHRDGGLGDQGHVDKDAVPLLDSVALEHIGKLANLAVKLAVGDDLFVTGLPFPDDGRLVGAGGVEMAVETVLGGIQLSSDKPFGIGKLPVEDLGPFLEPVEFLGLTGPKFIRALHRLGMELPVLGHALDPGFFRKLGGRLENAVLNKMGLDVLGHSMEGLKLLLGSESPFHQKAGKRKRITYTDTFLLHSPISLSKS